MNAPFLQGQSKNYHDGWGPLHLLRSSTRHPPMLRCLWNKHGGGAVEPSFLLWPFTNVPSVVVDAAAAATNTALAQAVPADVLGARPTANRTFSWLWSKTKGLHPHWSNNCTTSNWPFSQATCNGVHFLVLQGAFNASMEYTAVWRSAHASVAVLLRIMLQIRWDANLKRMVVALSLANCSSSKLSCTNCALDWRKVVVVVLVEAVVVFIFRTSELGQWVEPVKWAFVLPPSSFQQFLKCCCCNVTFTWCKGTNCFDVFSCGFASVFLLSLDFIDDFKRSSFSFCSGRLSADNSPFVLVGFFGSVWIDLSFFALGFFLGGGLKLF